jgi:hypothetical protein
MLYKDCKQKHGTAHEYIIHKRNHLSVDETEKMFPQENNYLYKLAEYVATTYLDYFNVKLSDFFMNSLKRNRIILSK